MQPCRRPPLAHLQGTSPDVLHEVVVAKDSYETPLWFWSHYVKSEALTVDVHASAFNAVAPRYITKADDPASLDEPLPRAQKMALGLLVPSLSLASCDVVIVAVIVAVIVIVTVVSSPSCHLRATGCTASSCGSTLRTGASARASNQRWRAACARCASAGAGWWHCCPLLFQDAVSSSASNSLRLRRVLKLRRLSCRFHTYVQHAHEVHYLRDKVAFLNPFMGKQGEHQTPLIVAIWRAGAPSEVPPRWSASLAAPSRSQSSADLLRVRRCRACGKWRLLPRHQATESAAGAFECCELWDERRASCASCGAGHVVCSWV